MTSPAVVDGVDIDAVTAAVLACAAVDDLYSTPAASVASYLPGRQVAGVRIERDTLTIQVRSYWGVPITEVAEQVRAAVRHLVAGRTVDVVIADLTDALPSPQVVVTPAPAPHFAATPAPIPSVAPSMPVDVAGEAAEQDEVVWTTSTGDADVSSSALTIPTTAETPPPSSPA